VVNTPNSASVPGGNRRLWSLLPGENRVNKRDSIYTYP